METQRLQGYRFGAFEVDLEAGELRRQGLRVRLPHQSFQVLCLLLERRGEVLTREQIAGELWPDGTFVDFDHGVNASVNRVRGALRDRANSPRFVETLPKRGYRFVAPVEVLTGTEDPVPLTEAESYAPSRVREAVSARRPSAAAPRLQWLASVEDLPKGVGRQTQIIFCLFQGMYLCFYVGALANLPEIGDLLAGQPLGHAIVHTVVLSAAVMIPVRLALLCAALLRPPRMQGRYLRLWPALLAIDALWALSPFLLLHHINQGVALALMTPLVYAPFAQRSLVLMGALGSLGGDADSLRE